MFFRLADCYHLGIHNGSNFILSNNDEPCVFLSPFAALILKKIIMGYPEEQIISSLSVVTDCNANTVRSHVCKLIDGLSAYLVKSDEVAVNVTVADDNIILHAGRSYDTPFPKEPVPSKLKFYLTDYCPRRCVYCFAGAKYHAQLIDRADSSFLTVERFREIICEAAQIGVKNIEISGGDPFVLKDICDYLKVMTTYFPFDWGTSTKAYISSERALEIARSGVKEMQVSIDSSRAKTVDKLLGTGGAFDEIMATISNLQKAGIYVTTKAVITSLNIDDMTDYIDFLIQKKITYARFSYYYISGNRHSDALYPTEAQLNRFNPMVETLKTKLNNAGIGTDLTTHTYKHQMQSDHRVFCGGFVGTMAVRYDGGVLFCDSLNHFDDFVVGNLKTQGIMEVWNSDLARKISTPVYFKHKYKGTKCEKCSLFDNCFNKRCYVRSYQYSGTPFDVDPACPLGDANYIIR